MIILYSSQEVLHNRECWHTSYLVEISSCFCFNGALGVLIDGEFLSFFCFACLVSGNITVLFGLITSYMLADLS
jgi:hypothetical protein